MGRPALLGDDDVLRLSAEQAVATMRDALVAHSEGRLIAPARAHTDLGDGRLVFTTGRLVGAWHGYRSYDTRVGGDQVVTLFDETTGATRALYVGREIGPRRVGAIGGVAADLLARPGATTVGMVGTGVQAWTQLWGIAAVRPLSRVRVFSRDSTRREAFAERARREAGLPVEAVASAQAAVDGADIVVLATSSPVPVVDSEWITDGAYVTTLGPKQVGSSEFDARLVDRADVAVTDSRAQLEGYDPPNVLDGTPAGIRLVTLGDVVTGRAGGRTRADEVALFCSVGLAGTEVWLLAHLLDRVSSRPGPAER